MDGELSSWLRLLAHSQPFLLVYFRVLGLFIAGLALQWVLIPASPRSWKFCPWSEVYRTTALLKSTSLKMRSKNLPTFHTSVFLYEFLYSSHPPLKPAYESA